MRPPGLLDSDIGGRARYASAFALLTLAWVLLFDYYAFRGTITIDILPDLLGYGLAVVAGRRLLSGHRDAARFTDLALALVVLAVLDVARGLGAAHFALTQDVWLFAFFLVDTVHVLLDIALAWLFTRIVIDMGRAAGAPDIAPRATNRRNLFVTYVAVAWASPFLSALLLPPDLARLFIVLLGAFATAAMAFLAHEMRQRMARLSTQAEAAM